MGEKIRLRRLEMKPDRSSQDAVTVVERRVPIVPDIEEQVVEKIQQWECVTREWPHFLILGINSYLSLYALYSDYLDRKLSPGDYAKYRGMEIIVIPVDEYVEVSGGCDWWKAHYVRDARPHMGKKETDDEDDETGVSEGPGGTDPDDGTPQGETWEGPAIVPSSAGA